MLLEAWHTSAVNSDLAGSHSIVCAPHICCPVPDWVLGDAKASGTLHKGRCHTFQSSSSAILPSLQDAAARIADASEVDTDESEEGTSGLEDTGAAPTASATSKEAAPAEDSSQSKFSPTETLEDGSMMFSTESLSTMSFEEILTP